MLLKCVLCALAGVALGRVQPGQWTSDARLIAVAVLSRAGDRQWGQPSLTKAGEYRMNFLGRVLSDRYGKALHLDVEGRYEASAGQGETVESANAVCQGMGQNAAKALRLLGSDDFDVTLQASGACRKYVDRMKHDEQSFGFRQLELDSKDTRREAAIHVGMSTYTMHDLPTIHERLLTLTPSPHLAKIEGLMTEVDKMRVAASRDIHVAGNLLREVNGFLRKAANHSNDAVVFKHWFGHYDTLTTFRDLVGLNVTSMPKFGTSYVAELSRTPADGYTYVRWYKLEVAGRNEFEFTQHESRVHVIGCQAPIFVADLNRYIQMTDLGETTVQQWCKWCGSQELSVCRPPGEESQTTSAQYRWYVYCAAALVLLITIVLVLVHFVNRPSRTEVRTVPAAKTPQGNFDSTIQETPSVPSLPTSELNPKNGAGTRPPNPLAKTPSRSSSTSFSTAIVEQ
eukprot:TRINITY_DN16002_c0_g1_i1.p1 TRINITY_DN16002_c0_g1~~TRINITY_DN16002_c0_g1_i1.p1  ORF type:complete len:455 (+),score=75.94 TRINITY_DN16002_c0_g1_i1:55-1419(+)